MLLSGFSSVIGTSRSNISKSMSVLKYFVNLVWGNSNAVAIADNLVFPAAIVRISENLWITGRTIMPGFPAGNKIWIGKFWRFNL